MISGASKQEGFIQTSANLYSQAQNLISGKNEPADIERDSCVKLRNIGYAMKAIKEMYKMMNGSAISKTIKRHREQNGVIKKNSQNDLVQGTFGFFVSYAENIKPINKNGLSNPYVIVRVPEGTVVPPQEEIKPDSKDGKPAEEPKATVLFGQACDLIR